MLFLARAFMSTGRYEALYDAESKQVATDSFIASIRKSLMLQDDEPLPDGFAVVAGLGELIHYNPNVEDTIEQDRLARMNSSEAEARG